MHKTVFTLIGKKGKKRMFMLLPVMAIGSLLEMLGLGLIVSVCTLLVSSDRVYDHWAVRWVCGLLGIRPGPALIGWIILGLMILYACKTLYLGWETRLVARTVQTTRREASLRLFRAMLRAPYPYFVRHSTAELQNLLLRDMNMLTSTMNAYLLLVLDVLTALGMGLVLAVVDPVMTAFAMGGIAVLLGLLRLIVNPVMERVSAQQRDASRARWKWMRQAVAGIKDVKIGHHEDFLEDQYGEAEGVFTRAAASKQFWGRLPSLIIEFVMVTALLAYLLFLVIRGQDLLDYLPGLSAMAWMAIRLLPICKRINSKLTQLRYAKASVDAVREAMEEIGPVLSAPALPSRPVAFVRGITLRGVSYTYEGGTGRTLEDADMFIPAGSAVGIAGPSGAGKTTLLDILLGLLIPEQGEVLVDDIPIRECAGSYLEKVAYVPQSTFLLDDSVRGNVAFGVPREEVSDEAVWAALEKAALAEKIRGLSDGLDAQIGEGGIRLSGGERQRLGIARALYRNCKVLVFDESTSALDPDTEAEILGPIYALRGEKTLIIVSHRRSAIDQCDLIYRVDGGRVDRLS